jgi:hypothetical protein
MINTQSTLPAETQDTTIPSDDTGAILEKMARGFSFEQAVDIIDRQRDFDNSEHGQMRAERHLQRQANRKL